MKHVRLIGGGLWRYPLVGGGRWGKRNNLVVDIVYYVCYN